MTRVGVSPRACMPICVEGWKKWSRSQAVSSLRLSGMVFPFGMVRCPGSGSHVDAEIYEVGEGLQAMARSLAPDAGLFPAAERNRPAGDLHPVDGDHAIEIGRAHV